jgi:DNA-binding HxlR family transcriptional regulator
MEHILNDLDKAFENRVRLGIMAVLMVNEQVDFNTFKELLKLTDGNLASHLKYLESSGYVLTNKQFIGRKPNTTYTATPEGKKAFTQHLNAIEALIQNNGIKAG